uniref:Msx2-interacting protein n=1 Tax=Phallusia mammillata TaxID=59560 RepID=A0A6F9DTR3_9ASCI|nr:msx2-interacting protein [Phallusia mammillata]
MRETRHLWVGNLPDNTREDKISDHFKRYGRIEKVKVLSKRGSDGEVQAVVAFVDLRSAQKAHNAVNTIGDKQLQTNYSEQAAMTSTSRHDSSPLAGNRHSQSATHRGYTSHRSDSKTSEGHAGDRPHSDRRRSHQGSSDSSRNPDLSDSKSSQKGSKDLVEGGNKKTERKNKTESKSKKKTKKADDSGKNVVSKPAKHKASRGRSPTVKKKTANRKQKHQGSSSDEDRATSSSYSSGTTGRSSSVSSGSSSVSSSRSNSSVSSSPRSTTAESDSEGGQKLVTMIIKKLPARPSVNNLREGIYHEFKKCGKVKSVVIRGDNNNRHALVLFRNASEANKSVNHAKSKLLFGAAIEAAIYEGEVSGKELQECGGIIDEFHPRASRTLFVGNLDKTVGYSDIQNIFVRFGEIVAIEIKRQNNVPQYAFLQYTDIASVVKAIQKMDGEKLGKNTLKLGFGKTVISSCIWVAGVTESFTEHYLASCFQKHGPVEYVVIDRNRGQALVFYCKFEPAQLALASLRGRKMNGSRLKLDFASHKLIELFLTDMQNSGQTATTFESIRHLILSAPTTPSAPPPTTSSSRSSSRPGSSHPYSSAPDSYFDRYQPPPTYDPSAPPRSEWRGWEERSRGRNVYHNVSPRGRRAYDDDRPERPDYYHRDEESFNDRLPPNYDPDYTDYPRREHSREYSGAPLPRGYADDYHRGLKPRDRRDPVYHSRHSPGRILRRSRSNSPRSGAQSRRGRIRDFDPKLEPRLHEHRDVPTGRGRSPARSPGSREDRGSGSDTYPRKYREHRYGSPGHYYSPPRRGLSPYSRRADERRVELRDGRSLPGSPRSGQGVRSKVVQDNSSQWSGASSRSQAASKPSESDEPWSAGQADYDRSRSETPTRDENLDSIGEIIIKQPVVSSVITRTVKQEISRQKSIDTTSTKTDASTKSSSRASSVHSEKEVETKPRKKLDSVVSERVSSSRGHLLQRVHSQSPPADSGSSKSTSRSQTEKIRKFPHDERRKSKVVSQRDSVQSGSDTESGRKDQKHRIKTEKDPSKRHRDSRGSSSNLLKREYSPSMEKAALKLKETVNVKQERSSLEEKDQKRRLDDRLDISDDRSNSDRERSTSKKRRHSELHASDNEVKSSSADKERRLSGSQDHRHGTQDRDNDENHAKPNKRVRKVSVKHDAPMSIASQSFMDEAIDDEVLDSGPEAREPSSQFRPRLSVKEEDIEVMPEMEVTEEVIDHSVDLQETEEVELEDKEHVPEESVPSVPVTKKSVGKVAIAQPFVSSYNPYSSTIVSATALMPVQVTKHKQGTEHSDIKKSENETPDQPASNLTELEKEKLHLEQLLSKLDSEQKLEPKEAGEVADIYITGITQKLKSHGKKDNKENPKAKELEISEAEEQPLTTAETTPVDTLEIQKPDIPVAAPEHHPVIDEVVAASDEEVITEVVEDEVVMVTNEEPVPVPIHTEEQKDKDVDLSKSYRKQMEAQRLKEQKRKEKELKSLLKKQRKEQERQSKLVQKMRGPSQAIISAVDEEEETESSLDGSSQATPVSNVLSASDTTPHTEIMAESTKHDAVFHEQKKADASNGDKDTPVAAQEKIGKHAEQVMQLEVEETKEIKKSPHVQKKEDHRPENRDIHKQPGSKASETAAKMAPPTNKTPIQVSPYTPKSASSLGKSSQTSHRSSSSNTNTPSPSQPKRKPHHHPEQHPHVRKTSSSGHRPDKHGQRSHPSKYHPADPKRRKVDHRQSSKHHESERKRNVYSPPKQVANLTVALNVSPSEPLGMKELETLKAELESMRNQLSMDMSPGFLSPSSEEETGTSPMSPILKSPTAERFMGLTMDTAEGKNLMVSPSQNRAQRLKQLGKVKKKTPLEDLTVVTVKEEEKIREMKKKLEDQRQLEFRHMRLFRSSIFEQDSARLSHLQQTSEPNLMEAKPSPMTSAPLFSNLVDLNIDNKPLFSSLIESSTMSSDTYHPQTVTATDNLSQVPKNAFPLSSDIINPATVESGCEIAGEELCVQNTEEVDRAQAEETESSNKAISVVGNESTFESVQTEDISLPQEEVTTKEDDTLPSSLKTNVPNPDFVPTHSDVSEKEEVALKADAPLEDTSDAQVETSVKIQPDVDHIVEDPASIEVVQQEDVAIYSEEVAPLEVLEEHVITEMDTEENAAPQEDATSVDKLNIEENMPEAKFETKNLNNENVESISSVDVEQKDEQLVLENIVEPEKVADDVVVEESYTSEVIPAVDDDFIESDLVIDAEEEIDSIPEMTKEQNVATESLQEIIPEVVDEILPQAISCDAEVNLPQSPIKSETTLKDDETIEAKIISTDNPLPKTECKKSVHLDSQPEGQVKKQLKPVSAMSESKEKKEIPFATKKDKTQGHTIKKHKTLLPSSKGDVLSSKIKKIKTEERRPMKTDKVEGKIKKDPKKLHKKIFKDQGASGKSPKTSEKVEKSSKTPSESTEKKIEKTKSKEKPTQKAEKKYDSSKPSKEFSSKIKSDKPVSKHKEGTKLHKSDAKLIKKEISDKSPSDSKLQKSAQSHEKSQSEVKVKPTSQERPSIDQKLSKVSSQDKTSSGDGKSSKSLHNQVKTSNEAKHSKLVESSKPDKSSSSSKHVSSHKSSGEKKFKSKHSEERKKLHKTSKDGHHSEGKVSKTDDTRHSTSKPHSSERHGDVTKTSSKKDKSKSESKKESVSGHDKKKTLLKKSSQKSLDTDQPVKKKPRLEERKLSITPHLTKSSFLNPSDSDEPPSSPVKKEPLQASSSKSKFSKYWSSDSDIEDVKPTPTKPSKIENSAKSKYSKPPVKQQHISSDSDSSDNYDDFISKMNKSSTAKKSAFYSSTDDESTDSDGQVTEKVSKPTVVQKVAKMERHGDSDQSDRSSHYKESPMSRKESPSMRHREQTKDKSKDRSKQSSTEKNIKEKVVKPEKKKKLEKKKLKKVPKKQVSDSEEEDDRDKRSKDRFHAKQAFDSEDEEISSHHTKAKVKKEHSSASHFKSRAPEEPRHSSLTSKLSSSSSSAESQDVPPPSPPSSFLTTKTIKTHTSYNPDYKDQFSASASLKKEPSSKTKPSDPRSIYSSSSSDLDSDLDFGNKPASTESPHFSKEERKTLLGMTSSDSDEDFNKVVIEPEPKAVEKKPEVKPKLVSKSQAPLKPSSEEITHKHSDYEGTKQPHKSSSSKSSENRPSKKHSELKSKSSFSETRVSSKQGDVRSEKKVKSKHEADIKKESSSSERPDKRQEENKPQKKHKTSLKVSEERSSGKHEEKIRESSDSGKKTSSKSLSKSERPTKPERSSSSGKTSQDSHKRHDDGGKIRHKHSGDKIRHKGEHHKLKSKTSMSKPHDTSEERRAPSKDEKVVKSSSSKTGSELHKPQHIKEKKSHPKVTEFTKAKRPDETKSLQSSAEKGKTDKHKHLDIKSSPSPSAKHVERKEAPKKREKGDEENESDNSLPGSSFFMASDTESKAVHQKADTKQQELKSDKNEEIEEKVFSPQTHSSPVQTSNLTKSIFSPSQSFETEERFSDTELKIVDSATDDIKHEPKQSVSRKSSLSYDSAERTKDVAKVKEERKRTKSRDLSPAESRQLALSAMERFQLQHERRRKNLEQQKTLERQRDEEAVRSIMGDDESDDLVSSSSDADYLSSRITKSYSDNEPSAESSYYSQPKPPVEEAAPLSDSLTPDASIQTDKSDTDKGKSSDMEPRSKAEEIELAAAVSSIEGLFDDFKDKQSSDPDSSYQAFDEPTKPTRTSPRQDIATYDESAVREAAEAASALLSDPLFPDKNTSSNEPAALPEVQEFSPMPKDAYSVVGGRSPGSSSSAAGFKTQSPRKESPIRRRSIERSQVKQTVDVKPVYEEPQPTLKKQSPEQNITSEKTLPVQPTASPRQKPAPLQPISTPKQVTPPQPQIPVQPVTIPATKHHPQPPPPVPNMSEARPFVPLSSAKTVQPEPSIKETMHSPQIGVHAELPPALPVPSHRPSKDAHPAALPERKPSGSTHVHDIALPKQTQGVVGAKTNTLPPFLMQGLRPDPYAPYNVPGPHLQKFPTSSSHAPLPHAKVSPQASPTFKFPTTSPINPQSAMQSPQHRPPATHVISPTPFVSPLPSNKAFPSVHQHAAFTHTQVTPGVEQKTPPLPVQSPTTVPALSSPGLQSRPHPVSPHLTSPRLPSATMGNLPSPTIRHSQPSYPFQAKQETPPNIQHSIQQPPTTLPSHSPPPTAVAKQHPRAPPPTAVITPVQKPQDTPPEPVRHQPPPTTHTSNQQSQRPPNTQPMPFQPTAVSAPQNRPMLAYQTVPGQQPRLLPPSGQMEPATTAVTPKSEPKPMQQMQIPPSYLYQQGLLYQKFPIAPGVSFPRSPFGYMPGMHIPIGFPPQASRPPTSVEQPRSFAPPPHAQFSQSHGPLSHPVSQPQSQPPQGDRGTPQTPTNKGRATPGTPKPPTTPQSPHVPSSPSAQGIPPQQMVMMGGRAPEPRPSLHEGSSRPSASQQDASAMVAKHFSMSGFPSPMQHRNAGQMNPSVFQTRPGLPAGFPPQIYRPEMGAPPFSHHLAMQSQQPPSQTRPPTSGHFYPPTEQQQPSSQPQKPTVETHHPALYHPAPSTRPSAPEPPMHHQQPLQHHPRAPVHHSYQQQPTQQDQMHHPQSPHLQHPNHPPRQHAPTQQTLYHPPSQPSRQRTIPPAEQPHTQTPPYQPPPETAPQNQQPPHHVARSEPTPAPQEQGKEAQASLAHLFTRYPVIWQGKVAIKMEFAAVQIHYVCGNSELAESGLPKHVEDESGLCVLRIARRMRLYPAQLGTLSSRMATESDFCMLLALPCGRDKEDIVRQTNQLSTSFIKYMKDKEVAGIAESQVTTFGQQQRILHIFPPCDFTSSYLQQRAPDLLSNVADIQHLLIVITPPA